MTKEIRFKIDVDIDSFKDKIDVARDAIDEMSQQVQDAAADFDEFESAAKEAGQAVAEFTGLSDDIVDTFQEFNRVTVPALKELRIQFLTPIVDEFSEVVRQIENLNASQQGQQGDATDQPFQTPLSSLGIDAPEGFEFLDPRRAIDAGLFALGTVTSQPLARQVTDAEASQRARGFESRRVNSENDINEQFRNLQTETNSELQQELVARRANQLALQEARTGTDGSSQRAAVAAEKQLQKSDEQINLLRGMLEEQSAWRRDALESIEIDAPIPEAP